MTKPALTLEYFRQKIGYHPYFFWGLAGGIVKLMDECNALITQYTWQNKQAAGRYEIEQAVQVAENLLALHLGYYPAPHYFTEVISLGCCLHNYYPTWNKDFLAGGYYSGNYVQSKYLTLGAGLVNQIGTISWSALGSAQVNYLDLDGDGLDDSFELTFADSSTNINLIQVAFQAADCITAYETDVADRFIQPVTVSRLDANTIKVTGRAWQVVKPLRYEGFGGVGSGADYNEFGLDSSGAIDPDDSTNFVVSLDLYKKVVTNLNQAVLTSEATDGTLTDYTYNLALCNNRFGWVKLSPANGGYYPACNCTGLSRQYLTVNYTAGDNLLTWATYIARLALAELNREICNCKQANSEVYRWQFDMARGGGTLDEQFRISPKVLGNPLGTKAGHVEAWLQIKAKRLARSVSV